MLCCAMHKVLFTFSMKPTPQCHNCTTSTEKQHITRCNFMQIRQFTRVKVTRPRKIFQHLSFISQKEVLPTADQISFITISWIVFLHCPCSSDADVEPPSGAPDGPTPGRELQREPEPSPLPQEEPPSLQAQQKLHRDGTTLRNPTKRSAYNQIP